MNDDPSTSPQVICLATPAHFCPGTKPSFCDVVVTGFVVRLRPGSACPDKARSHARYFEGEYTSTLSLTRGMSNARKYRAGDRRAKNLRDFPATKNATNADHAARETAKWKYFRVDASLLYRRHLPGQSPGHRSTTARRLGGRCTDSTGAQPRQRNDQRLFQGPNTSPD